MPTTILKDSSITLLYLIILFRNISSQRVQMCGIYGAQQKSQTQTKKNNMNQTFGFGHFVDYYVGGVFVLVVQRDHGGSSGGGFRQAHQWRRLLVVQGPVRSYISSFEVSHFCTKQQQPLLHFSTPNFFQYKGHSLSTHS